MRSSNKVFCVLLCLGFIVVVLPEDFVVTDFGEAAELTLLFVAICAAMIGGLLRLLECAHDEKPKTGVNAGKLTSHGR